MIAPDRSTGPAAPPVIALALGDPNGIGPEVAVAAASTPALGARVLLVGDTEVIVRYAGEATVRVVDPSRLPAPRVGTLDVVAVAALADGAFRPGRCDAASGRATVAYVERALALVDDGVAAAVLAGPHHEGAVNAAGIAFSGYPSLIARLTGKTDREIFLLLVGGGLRIVHATLHERLADALARLDPALVAAAARAAHRALRTLGIANPRIGVFGINPHAGEGGLFGDDDDRITAPAAAVLRSEGLDVVGPLGADLLLSERGCDAYVAAFHDQGHIPVKLLAGRDSTALTIGAGVVFASVGHGSAPDIAGLGRADAGPLLRALKLLAGAQAGGPETAP